jgi:hypothetical protein
VAGARRGVEAMDGARALSRHSNAMASALLRPRRGGGRRCPSSDLCAPVSFRSLLPPCSVPAVGHRHARVRWWRCLTEETLAPTPLPPSPRR